MNLIDSRLRTYDVDTSVLDVIVDLGFKPLYYDHLGPGLEFGESRYIVFDIPENDTGLKLGIAENSFSEAKEYITIGDVPDFSGR